MSKKRYLENPFIEYIPSSKKLVTEEIDNRIEEIIDHETGEIDVFSAVEIVERKKTICTNAKFVKIVTDNMRLISALPLGARKLLDIVTVIIQMDAKDKDYFHMTQQQASEIAQTLGFNISKTMFYKSVNQLIEGHIIAPTTNNCRYWLNIGVMLNGDYRRIESLRKRDSVHFLERRRVS